MTVKPKEPPPASNLAIELSFHILLELSSGQVSCPQKKLMLSQAVNDSPLHKYALQGLTVFIEKEGQEKLNEIVAEGMNVDIHQLVINGVVENMIRTPV